MTQEEHDAVQLTDAMFARTDFSRIHVAARLNGHAIVSQGCGHVRCIGCDMHSFYGRGGDGLLTTSICSSRARSAQEELIMVNKYPGPCGVCGGHVARNAGNVKKIDGVFRAVHLACLAGAKGVDVYVIGGREYIQNRRGRCEDAPCCGCCTI